MKEYIEKEIKVKLENPLAVIDQLRRSGALFLGGALEKTVRFDTDNLDYEKNGKFIRCRSGFSNTITLKEKIKDASTNVRARKETEFEIEDIDKMQYILETLGLTYTRTMEKYRQQWKFNNVSITIDELCFGIFMEIEGEESEIYKTCEILGINADETILVTYWDLWKEVSDSKDIVFEKGHVYTLI